MGAKKKKKNVSGTLSLDDIRRIVVIAMFSDDVLMEKLVLKGGNALSMIHRLGGRTSIDIDLSMEGDFSDVQDIEKRIFRSLHDRFDSAGLVVFDESFTKKPEVERDGQDPRWGGYSVEFKVIEKDKFKDLGGNIEALRRNSSVVGPEQKRIFTIDISKHEFCHGKQATELDHYTVYVYTLPMMAIEKLRAICQQMEEYELRNYRTPRARDFYDIHTIVINGNITLPSAENFVLLQQIFAAKNVPVEFLTKISGERDFHRPDWDSVVNSASGQLRDFDFYFDFVLELADALHAYRVE